MSHLLGGGKHDIDRREAVGGKQSRVTLMKEGITGQVGDDEQVDVAPRMVGSSRVRAEEDDTLGSKGADKALDDTS